MPLDVEKIETQAQHFDAGAIVDLYEMDLQHLDGSVLRFTSGVDADGNAIVWDGFTYLPLPIVVSGFEASANAQFPRPSMSIANVNGAVTAVNLAFDNLLGVRVRRIRTFSQFLDGGTDPDTTAKYPDQVYQIERKTGQNKLMVEYQLSSPIDASGATIPGRTINRNGCPLSYRIWNATDGVFEQGKCPYAGTLLFKVNDEPTTSESEDVCGKRLNSCELRFGPVVLPIQAMPGVAGVR